MDYRLRTLIFLAVLVALYTFTCSLSLLSRSFRLISSSQVSHHSLLNSSHLHNSPVLGLALGILSTALFQSSSATTSLVVTLVASSALTVKQGIPIIMGTNIGTSLTSTIVALYNIKDMQMYRLGFAAAILHDIFNWVTVLVLLPLEILTGFLETLSSFLIGALFDDSTKTGGGVSFRFLETILDPILDRIVKLKPSSMDLCSSSNSTEDQVVAFKVKELVNSTPFGEFKEPSSEEDEDESFSAFYNDETINQTESRSDKDCSILLSDCGGDCNYLFASSTLSDETIGVIILLFSLLIFIASFATMVKGLKAIVKGDRQSACLSKEISAATFCTDLILIVSGFFVTFLIQSSSVVTSAIVPLASSKAISLERAYAFTVGANLGTTTTSILASLSLASSLQARYAFQLALCHTIFNVSGLLLFYPIPFMRWPLFMAKILGSKVEKYKWFSIFYLVTSFFLIPLAIYGLSLINTVVLYIVVTLVTSLTCLSFILTHLQVTRPHLLPEKLKDWSFLPRQLRSFEIVDYVVQTYIEVFCCCIVERTVMLSPLRNDERQRDKNVLQLGLGANLQLVKTKK